MSYERVLVIAGDHFDSSYLALPAHDYLIAADSGIGFARRSGLSIDLAIGDFDSVEQEDLDALAGTSTVVERQPVAKDATDLELAMDRAIALEPQQLYVASGRSGRFDHVLGNTLVIASEKYSSADVVAFIDDAWISVVHREQDIAGKPGGIVSLLPVNGPAVGVTTSNLLYPLDNEDLLPSSTRGMSNELTSSTARVSVRAGTLLVVVPNEGGAYWASGFSVEQGS